MQYTKTYTNIQEMHIIYIYIYIYIYIIMNMCLSLFTYLCTNNYKFTAKYNVFEFQSTEMIVNGVSIIT